MGRAASPRPAPATRVQDVMTREVVTLAPTQPFQEAITVLAKRRFHHVLVADAQRTLLGVISDRDLLRFMVGQTWESAVVGDVMVTDPVSVQPEDLLSTACETMIARRINCLPGVDEAGRIVGILTSTDLLKAYMGLQAEIEKDGRAA